MASKATAPTKKSASTRTQKAASPSRAQTRRPKDACDLLDADHKAVKKLFDAFKALAESRSRSPGKRRALADEICRELIIHATIEEEIFYSAARGAIKDKPLLNEAEVEHASAKDLIAQIGKMDVGHALFDAKVIVLGEYIDHHVKEERSEMFPKARKSKLDLVRMREQLQNRKDQLMAEFEANPFNLLAA